MTRAFHRPRRLLFPSTFDLRRPRWAFIRGAFSGTPTAVVTASRAGCRRRGNVQDAGTHCGAACSSPRVPERASFDLRRPRWAFIRGAFSGTPTAAALTPGFLCCCHRISRGLSPGAEDSLARFRCCCLADSHRPLACSAEVVPAPGIFIAVDLGAPAPPSCLAGGVTLSTKVVLSCTSVAVHLGAPAPASRLAGGATLSAKVAPAPGTPVAVNVGAPAPVSRLVGGVTLITKAVSSQTFVAVDLGAPAPISRVAGSVTPST